MRSIFLTLARANRWANELLYAEMAKLTPELLAKPLSVNFGSVLGIANHTILADRAWLHRLSGEGESPPALDAVPYPDILGSLAARRAEDARVIAFAEGLDPARLASTLRYTAMNGTPCAEPFAVCLMHFYNHQTFHRGQIHAVLGVLGIQAPDLDLIYYQAAQRNQIA